MVWVAGYLTSLGKMLNADLKPHVVRAQRVTFPFPAEPQVKVTSAALLFIGLYPCK